MRVDIPEFDSSGEVMCDCCPFQGMHGSGLCLGWGQTHEKDCPTRETYAEACAAAEAYEVKP